MKYGNQLLNTKPTHQKANGKITNESIAWGKQENNKKTERKTEKKGVYQICLLKAIGSVINSIT